MPILKHSAAAWLILARYTELRFFIFPPLKRKFFAFLPENVRFKKSVKLILLRALSKNYTPRLNGPIFSTLRPPTLRMVFSMHYQCLSMPEGRR